MRKTKIVATLGPATESPDMLARLVAAGVDIFRLNMSHAKPEWVRRLVVDIRQAAREAGRIVGVLMDLQGPSIRTGDVPAPIPLAVGERFCFCVRGATPPEGSKGTAVNYDLFARDVQVGATLVVDNGDLKMRILAKTEDMVECEVLTEGSLGSRRHINLPGVRVSLPALTEKDRNHVALGLEVAVDFIALSFVREPADIGALRACFDGVENAPQIVAKIEHQFAVDHFEAIAHEADAVMVARGDLGIECPFEELPIIQRRLVKTCHRIGRPVIVATEMLESMIENPLPTRAEITDVANAVFEQADAIMLSGETTVGRYPVACVEVMDRIARRIERSGGSNYQQDADLTQPRQKLVRSAVTLADHLRAAAIMVFTRTGRMAWYAAWQRPRHSPIYAFCTSAPLAARLTICRGLQPLVMPACLADPEGAVTGALGRLTALGCLHRGDTVVALMPPASALDQQMDTVKMLVA